MANALAEAETTGIRLIDKAPRKGAEGLQIAFTSQINFGRPDRALRKP